MRKILREQLEGANIGKYHTYDINLVLRTLSNFNYERFLLCNGLDIELYPGHNIRVMGDYNTVRLFLDTRAVSIDIPYNTVIHPEKLVATKYSMFNVFEYTKVLAVSTKEVDLKLFQLKFNKALVLLIEDNE